MLSPTTLLCVITGLVLTGVTLADIFATILVPGPAEGVLRIGARLRQPAMLAARLFSFRRRTPRQGRSNVLAPLVFLLIFASWMLLLLLGYGLLFFGLRHHFTPELTGLDDALYFAGSSLLTLGVSEVNAHGPARWLLLAAGLSGFGVITATLTFVVQVQSALHQRESRVLTLASLAGTPPTGIGLLQAVASLDVGSELHDFFRIWRDWAAAMLHSHIASPMLIFFHSVDAESDWLTSLEAVLDAATMLMALTQHEARGAATLMHRTGSRTAARLAGLLGVEALDPAPLGAEVVRRLIERLRQSGYVVDDDGEEAIATFERLRGDYAGRINALAKELGG
ncbi:ion channel [Sphingomonas sp.]|uniref:ion channel n=1 Tax=Sphingomonas sp. TaxID=28214 RepID=UPI003CC6DA1D